MPNRVRVSRVATDYPTRVRVARVRVNVDTASPTTNRIRVSRVVVTTSVTPPVSTNQTAEPGELVTINLAGADSYTVTQTSGTTVSLAATPTTRTFLAPQEPPPGVDLGFQIVGSSAGGGGFTNNIVITVLPELVWQASEINAGVITWIPARSTPATTVTPPTGQFVEFTPGAVMPVGIYDSGTRNVGPRVATSPYNGNVTIADGQTVSGLEIFGNVTFTGTGVLRDCVIHGAVASSGVAGPFPNRLDDPLSAYTGIVTGSSSDLKGSLIEWCRLDAIGFESVWQDGIRGGNYTAQYCEIYGAVDGLGMVLGGNGIVRCCRISHGYYTAFRDTATGNPLAGFPSSPSDRTTHADGAQIHQFGGWEIRGCYIGGTRSTVDSTAATANRDPQISGQLAVIQQIDAATEYRNAAIIVNTTNPNITAAVIENNWLQGGNATVNISANGTDPMVGVHVRNNRIIRITSNAGFVIYRNTNHTGLVTGNVFDDTGAAATITNWT